MKPIHLISIFGLFFLFFFSLPKDQLKKTGLLGLYEIDHTRLGKKITEQNYCCTYIELSPDSNKNDLIGNYIIMNHSEKTTGTFKLEKENLTITFISDFGNRKYTYNLEEVNARLTLFPLGQDSSLKEKWVKLN